MEQITLKALPITYLFDLRQAGTTSNVYVPRYLGTSVVLAIMPCSQALLLVSAFVVLMT